MKKFENTIESTENKHMYKIQDYGESAKEQGNTSIYYYVNLNPFPTYKKVVNHMLGGDNGDTSNYNQKPIMKSRTVIIHYGMAAMV